MNDIFAKVVAIIWKLARLKRTLRAYRQIAGPYQCPTCGLYMSRMLRHTEADCERVRAIYPMLLHPLEESYE